MAKFEIVDIIGQCSLCSNKDGDKPVCKAFPKGIPNIILTGKFNHTKKHPDQNNDIVFADLPYK